MRDTAEELVKIRESLREESLRTISSPRIDGQPKGGGSGDAMAAQVARKERLQEKLASAEKTHARQKRQALKALRREKTTVRMFCEAYYIDGDDLLTACEYAGIEKRTGERYMQEIRRKGGKT